MGEVLIITSALSLKKLRSFYSLDFFCVAFSAGRAGEVGKAR